MVSGKNLENSFDKWSQEMVPKNGLGNYSQKIISEMVSNKWSTMVDLARPWSTMIDHGRTWSTMFFFLYPPPQ